MWKRDQSVTPANSEREPLMATSADRPTSEPVVLDLGKSVMIKGELSGSEDFTLHGQMEGSVKLLDHTLTIGPQAAIKANVSAKAVVIMGSVIGNVTAAQTIEIGTSGSVTGDVTAPRLAIADGGFLKGRVEMPKSPGGTAR